MLTAARQRSTAVTAAVLVFVVEDEAPIQHLLDEALTEGGFAVTMASNGEDAMAMLDAADAAFAALITDVNLPGKFTGWEVAIHGREINGALPVIYITGGSAHDWASKGVPNSILLTKPFAVAQVVTAVSQLLNASPPLSLGK
jgi:DNA-binding response OmpR family regulator